jgi:hypothetical protein
MLTGPELTKGALLLTPIADSTELGMEISLEEISLAVDTCRRLLARDRLV